MKKIRKAIIPAAGFGTRFLPATKALAKEMLPIIDTPTIQYIIEEAKASGIDTICIVTSAYKKSIEDHFDKSFELEHLLMEKNKEEFLKQVREISSLIKIYYIRQNEPLGLGHAILCAKDFVGDEPFAVLLGDDVVYNEEKPALKQLIDVYEEHDVSVVGGQLVADEAVNKYGIIGTTDKDLNDDTVKEVSCLVEKPELEDAPSNLAILGRYVLKPEIFKLLETQPRGAGNEIQLTDAIARLLDNKQVYAKNFSGRRYDVGDKFGYLEATIDYALRRDDLRDKFIAYVKKLDLV